MECPSCGRQNPDNHNFCFYCGFNLKDFDPSEEIINRFNASRMGVPGVITQTVQVEEEINKPMKVWQWAVYFMLMIIPFCWLIWLVLTFIWAFGKRGTKERKQFAKGMLIATLIVVIALLMIMIYMISHYGIDYFINYITNGVATSAEAYLKKFGGGLYY